VSDLLQDSVLRLVTALMPELNPHDPLDEAAFAAMETVAYLFLARSETARMTWNRCGRRLAAPGPRGRGWLRTVRRRRRKPLRCTT
jgi:hypothetical protein